MKYKIKEIEKPQDFREDCAALHPTKYEKIFGETFKNSGYLPDKRGILKIRGNNGNVIYRQYWGNSTLNGEEIYFDKHSCHILGVEEGGEVEVSKGSKLYFYWNHPTHINRFAVKFAIISLAVGILGVAVGVAGFFL